jgi:peptidoglycan/xylan/chitin deacetylase (PgdA/CDA1 family)
MKRLTLSFDNGPEPAVTPVVLDTLARHGLRSTFFVIGSKLADPAARACAERAAAEGHWIGNHTWTHSLPLGRQPGRAALEIAQTQDELGALAHPLRWFRPMGGGGAIGPHLLSPDAVSLLEAGGYSCVLWNAIPRDWAEPDAWMETALAQLDRQDWTLMVLHDLPTGAMTHLDAFLCQVKDRGVMLRQDFPADCVPILAGSAIRSVDHLVTGAGDGDL